MGGGVRDQAHIARRLGIHVVDLPYPQSIGDIETAVDRVAGAVGKPASGQRLNARIEALKHTAPAAAADTIWLGGGGRSVASTGLTAEWMRLAGFRQRPLIGDRVTLEQLLARPPAILLRSDYRAGQYSGEQRWMMHPLAKGTAKSRVIPTDGRAWTCMGPAMVGEVERLRKVAER
jgi:iron complex transport system substrate-binding protein